MHDDDRLHDYVLIEGEHIARIEPNFTCYPCYGVPIWVLRLPRTVAESRHLARVDFLARRRQLFPGAQQVAANRRGFLKQAQRIEKRS